MTCICYGHIIWNIYWKNTVATHTHWLEMSRLLWQYFILWQQQLIGLKLVGGRSSELMFKSVHGKMTEKRCHFLEPHRGGSEQGVSPPYTSLHNLFCQMWQALWHCLSKKTWLSECQEKNNSTSLPSKWYAMCLKNYLESLNATVGFCYEFTLNALS